LVGHSSTSEIYEFAAVMRTAPPPPSLANRPSD
jgi:hypothetical protein